MGGDCLARLHEFFQQRVADDREPRLPPQRALADEQFVPIALVQGTSQLGRRVKQRAVFVEQGQSVTHRATRRRHGVLTDFACMRQVDPRFNAG